MLESAFALTSHVVVTRGGLHGRWVAVCVYNRQFKSFHRSGMVSVTIPVTHSIALATHWTPLAPPTRHTNHTVCPETPQREPHNILPIHRTRVKTLTTAAARRSAHTMATEFVV